MIADSKRLKVVLIPPEEWLPGMETFVHGECPDPVVFFDLLANNHGIDVELIDPGVPKWIPLVHRHPIYRGLDPVRAIKVLFGRRKVDVVISVFESSATVLSFLRSLIPFKPKLIMWDIAPDEVWRPRRLLQNLTVPRVDNILLLSSQQQSYLEARWHAGDKAKMIWQSVDTDFYQPEPAQPQGPVLAIGDDHGRDWPTLIEALAPLDIELVLKTRSKVELPEGARLRVRQISKRVSFRELRDLYAKASIVVIPLSETLNVSGVGSVLESMAMGKALVISDNPPIRDYLEPGKTADVVPVGDALALRTAVKALLADNNRMEQMGRLARERVVQLYGNEAFAHRFAAALRDICNDSLVEAN
ncbi:hypothetical protein CBP34_17805 [Acidovorax carolinensis]|uniref:Glycosyl transferase family 1 domain-containing protein n=1 Tax=Acidovorax carolinensis TaxID=553814 RepID=A0A240U6Y0_9BURK|nr:glycosyltransferase family 4 protein [Acidovorax carolinensis]ART53143.1 hypothetical protein CBP34_17805 [Acidovorax carolinensis]